MRFETNIVAAGLILIATLGCNQPELVPPRSLDSPSSVAVARGDVCLTTFEDLERVIAYTVDPCPEGQTGAIGLVANEQSDRIALIDLNAEQPRLVDLDPATPGVTHLVVGRLPVEVAASPDGTAGYSLNQLDRDISIIDLTGPRVLEERIHLDDTPIGMQVRPVAGDVVVAMGSPSFLAQFPSATTCSDDAPESGYRCEVGAVDSAPLARLDLPGTVSDFVFAPDGDEAWLIYRDLDYASVVSFAPTADGFDTPCLDGTAAKPCVVAHVSLGFECQDGLDNDGDGRVDQQDAQCYGPTAAESPEGVGRMVVDACSNGIDDDNDGFTDRDDPDCVASSSMDEGAPTPWASIPVTACNDDVDNDGDGPRDGGDFDCYGSVGRSESAVRTLGLDKIGIDEQGVYVYAVDRAREQVLVIDAARKRRIDAGAASMPSIVPYEPGLGVNVSLSPIDVTGFIDRAVIWRDPDDEGHAIIRHDFGAWIAVNNGTIQYVDTAVAYCEVSDEDLSTNDEFYRGVVGVRERECLDTPVFPLATGEERILGEDAELHPDCRSPELIACVQCQRDGGADCGCEVFADTMFDLCQRSFVRENRTLFVNPRFSLRDASSEQGRIVGAGTCEFPEELVEAMQDYASENPRGPQSLRCDTPLAPQPRSLDSTAVELADVEALPRADLHELRTLLFDTDSDRAPLVTIRPQDHSLLDETWKVSFEGVIPGTSRGDGVLPQELDDESVAVLDVGFDVCSAGVEVGDRLTIESALDGCEIDGELTFEVSRVWGGQIEISTIDGDGFATSVPTRGCFGTAISYSIRPHEQWTVVGDIVGFLSPNETRFDECVPRVGAELLRSRVETGGVWNGPYFTFRLFEGADVAAIPPVRGMSYSFTVSRGFASLRYETTGAFPTQVLFVPNTRGGSFLLAPDPNDDFVFALDLSTSAGTFSIIR